MPTCVCDDQKNTRWLKMKRVFKQSLLTWPARRVFPSQGEGSGRTWRTHTSSACTHYVRQDKCCMTVRTSASSNSDVWERQLPLSLTTPAFTLLHTSLLLVSLHTFFTFFLFKKLLFKLQTNTNPQSHAHCLGHNPRMLTRLKEAGLSA